ncbi:MAG: hypothetical protein RR240_12120, partial [Burkholderiaceae bacterium]
MLAASNGREACTRGFGIDANRNFFKRFILESNAFPRAAQLQSAVIRSKEQDMHVVVVGAGIIG